jgi:light-regulated signal transduction histidine kinase (bacteriophytochrome)
MENIIDSLLYYSRLGRAKIELKNSDLNSIIQDVLESFQILIREENIEITVDSLPKLHCDPTRVKELFRNLIDNAIKYNTNPHKKIQLGCKQEDHHSIFFIKDNGIGIERVFFEDIFKLFRRLHTQSEFGGGTGAGLSFVKKIIEKHGGEIWVESTLGLGTTFYFTLQKQ